MFKRSAITALLVAVLMSLASPSFARTGHAAPMTTWAAVGDSITLGWGSSDPATKAYYVAAGVPAAANPGQCLVAAGCWGTPLVSSFPTELAWLRDTRGGVNAVVVEIGVNDLPRDITDQQFFDGYAQLEAEGAAQGVRVVLSTITPRRGLTAEREAQRERINTWIRSQGVYVDYAAAVGGNVLAPAFDSGDGLHPSDAGHAAMGHALRTWINLDALIRSGGHRVPLNCLRVCGPRPVLR